MVTTNPAGRETSPQPDDTKEGKDGKEEESPARTDTSEYTHYLSFPPPPPPHNPGHILDTDLYMITIP